MLLQTYLKIVEKISDVFVSHKGYFLKRRGNALEWE